MIDGNLGDGVSIGNTPGPYTVAGNRISGNGRYGYREHNLSAGDDGPAGPGTGGGQQRDLGQRPGRVHIDAAMADAALVGQPDLGQRPAVTQPATSGGRPLGQLRPDVDGGLRRQLATRGTCRQDT